MLKLNHTLLINLEIKKQLCQTKGGSSGRVSVYFYVLTFQGV